MTMSKSNARNEWYVLSPEGSSRVIVHIGHDLRMAALAEESTWDDHLAAHDRVSGLIQAVVDGEVSADVTAEEATAVVYAWDADTDPEMVTVERINAT
jgi:hypothetical protein